MPGSAFRSTAGSLPSRCVRPPEFRIFSAAPAAEIFTMRSSSKGENAASAEIKLALLPRLSAMEMNAMFTPLAEYLSKETGEKVSLVIPKDFEAF